MDRLRRTRLIIPALSLFLLTLAILAQPAAAFHDRDCSDFSTQAKAQHFFKKHHPNRDPHGLDADHDGIACEDLP